jgi:hypothetical protein
MLRADDREIDVRLSAGARKCSLLHGVLIGSEADPALYKIGTGDFLPRDKVVGTFILIVYLNLQR